MPACNNQNNTKETVNVCYQPQKERWQLKQIIITIDDDGVALGSKCASA